MISDRDLSVFLAKYGSDLVTLYGVLLDEGQAALASFQADFFRWLARISETEEPMDRLSFIRMAIDLYSGRERPVRAALSDSAWQELSLEQRIVTWLRDGAGLTYAEICEVTGLSEREVRSRIHESRMHIARLSHV